MPTESGRLPTAEQLGVRLENLHESDQSWIEQLSKFLPNCFSKYFPRWVATSGASIEQIRKSFERGPSRVVVDQDEQVLGWAAAITDETQWEIHPIAVSPKHQRQGLGRILVEDLEYLAREAGAVSVWVGTSDETYSTSFSRIDLYQDAGSSLTHWEAPTDHPLRFYLGVGYSLVGVLPDEEGLGKPGIHFAKRIVED